MRRVVEREKRENTRRKRVERENGNEEMQGGRQWKKMNTEKDVKRKRGSERERDAKEERVKIEKDAKRKRKRVKRENTRRQREEEKCKKEESGRK